MYGLSAPGIPIKEVEIPHPDPLAPLRYSCVYWIEHLCVWCQPKNANDRNGLKLVDEFLRSKYLYWLEALCLLGNLSDGVRAIMKLDDLLQVSFINDTAKYVEPSNSITGISGAAATQPRSGYPTIHFVSPICDGELSTANISISVTIQPAPLAN